MKTYEEAVKTILATESNLDRLDSDMKRYESLISDIRCSESFKIMLFAMVNSMDTRNIVSIADTIFTAFANGVIVGIEMEKQDI